jgi:hypothetical protein
MQKIGPCLWFDGKAEEAIQGCVRAGRLQLIESKALPSGVLMVKYGINRRVVLKGGKDGNLHRARKVH